MKVIRLYESCRANVETREIQLVSRQDTVDDDTKCFPSARIFQHFKMRFTLKSMNICLYAKLGMENS